MNQTYKTEGIILKRWNYKEQDRMVRILTRDNGKITTRAISARKIQSKLAGHLEPFVHANFFIARSKTIDIVAGSSTIHAHARVRQSLSHIALAHYFSDVVDMATQERDVDPALYEHVRRFYDWLDESSAHILGLYAALLQLFSIIGYRLELYECHACKKSIQPTGNKLHLQLWNMECVDCRSTDETLPIEEHTIKLLRFLLEQPLSEMPKIKMEQNQWTALHYAVRSLVRYHFGREIRSEEAVFQLLHAEH